MTYRIRWRGVRIENAGNGVSCGVCGAQPRGEEHPGEEEGQLPVARLMIAGPIPPFALSRRASSSIPLRLQVNQRLVTALAVEDQIVCTPYHAMQSPSDCVRSRYHKLRD